MVERRGCMGAEEQGRKREIERKPHRGELFVGSKCTVPTSSAVGVSRE